MFSNMEYVYEVYQAKSFSKAAQQLYISQPSLSATIKKIEKKIGTPIFDRSSNPIQLTQCGEEYIKCIEKVMDIQNNFCNYLYDSADLKAGTITIGACNFFAAYILPPIIAAFKTTYPNIQIHLVEADTSLVQQKLFAGELDMIIDNYNFSESIYKKHRFSSETLILAVPKGALLPLHKPYQLSADDIRRKLHLDPRTPAVPLELFDGFPFIALRYGNDTRERFERIQETQGFSPNIVLELDQLATAYHVCCHGLGITLTSDTLVKEIPAADSLSYFRIDSPEVYRDNHVYYKQGKYLSQAMKKFISFAAAITLD